jgi:hypothetical protein
VGEWTSLHGSWRVIWLLVAVGVGGLAYALTQVALGLRPHHLRH